MDERLLADSPLFEGIRREEISPLLACLGGYEKKYDKGQMIFLETCDIRCVGVILSGSVYMTKESMDGKKAILVHMRAGEIFGETFACGLRTDSVVSFEAAEKTGALLMPFHKIMNTCTMSCMFHHRLIENMVRMLTDKNIRLMNKVEVITQRSLRDKILVYLQQEAARQGSREIVIGFGRQELADYLCADRSSLTRELYHMQKEGMLTIDRNKFCLLI